MTLDPQAVLLGVVSVVVAVVGYLLKRGMDEKERHQEAMRVEVNAKLDGIVLDIKTIVATTSSQHTDIRVLEERQRKLEDEQARTDERVRKLDEEMTLQRTKSHDLAGKIQVVRALVERRSSEDQEVNGQREAG
jgi:hypothetical protein